MHNRNDYFDNARFILVFWVIIGHFWGVGIFQYWNVCPGFLRNFIYSFHMPLIALISGYFSKNATSDKLRIYLNRLLVPFVIFQVLYLLWFQILKGEIGSIHLQLTYPFHGLWYLWALFFWRIFTPYIVQLKHPIVISICIALAIGYFSDIGLKYEISKLICFLPFYLIGLYSDFRHFTFLANKNFQILSICVLSTSLFAFYFYMPEFSYWFYLNLPYSTMKAPEITAVFYRLLIYCIIFINGISFLSIVPHRKTWFTKYGKYTIYPYLLHMPILWLHMQLPNIYTIAMLKALFGDVGNIVYITSVSAFLMIALSTLPVRNVFRWIVEPKWIK